MPLFTAWNVANLQMPFSNKRAVQGMYKDSEAAVKVGEEITEWFEVQRGVRQGCLMSPWLFNIYLDMVTREALPLFKKGSWLNQLPDTGDIVCR